MESQLNQNYPLRSPFTRRRDYFWQRETFAGAGQASFFKPPAQDPDMFELLTNVQPIAQGTLQRRWGYKQFFAQVAHTYTRAYEYQNETTLTRYLLFCTAGNVLALNEDGTLFSASIFAPAGGAAPRLIVSRGSAYFFDGTSGDLQKWTPPSTLTGWGIAAPNAAPLVAGVVSSGAITLNQGRNYFQVYQNSSTGQLSDLSAASASSGPLSGENVSLQSLAVSGDAQVDTKLILATGDGGDETTLYEVASLANATTTYTDVMPEETLLAQNIFQQTDAQGVLHGVSDNAPPPNGTFAIKHAGRLYMLVGSSLYFSKNLDDLTTSTATVCGRYEECWPAVNQLDISNGAEIGSGLMTDGTNLYIGTERHIRILSGTGPLDFTTPEVIFNEVGLLNQEVARMVFTEGSPTGAIWFTPDLRIIQSDFNTYRDIGTPIQDVLNTANTAILNTTAYSQMFSNNAYDLYVLAIPTGSNTSCDTLCIYDLRAQRWQIWKPADNVTCLLNNIKASGVPQLVFGSPLSNFYVFDPSLVQDRGTSFASTVRTSWLNFEDGTVAKILQSLEVATGDPSLAITIEGASTDPQFTTSNPIVTNASLVSGPFGRLNVFLAGKPTKDRYYRFTFTSTGTAQDILSMWKLWFLPAHRI